MKRISVLLLLGVFCFIVQKSNSQSVMHHVIASAGTNYQTSQYVLSWTLGEAIIGTFDADAYILTQGFHQPLAMAASLLGDANCDGEINVLDVVSVINFILEANPTPFCPENADVNDDSTIDILDAVTIINMILSQDKTLQFSDNNSPAHIYLCENGIDIQSEGNLAGLQLEFYGHDIGEIGLAIEGYELMLAKSSNRLKAVIINLANTPFPSGRIRLISFTEASTELAWGQVKGANSSGQNILVFPHIEQGCAANLMDYNSNVYPNPSFGSFMLQMELPQPSEVSYMLYDILGNQVKNRYEVKLDQGMHLIPFSLPDLSPGIYTLSVITKELSPGRFTHIHHHKIVINKQ